MKPANDMEETIKKNLNFTASAEMRERILTDVMNAQEEAKKTKSALIRPNIRSIIMKSPITKLAAAAMIILIVVFGMTFLDKSSVPAYGMNDALYLLRQAKTLHIQGWRVTRNENTSKVVKLPFEYWYDLENWRYRNDDARGLDENGEIDYTSDVCDGEYILREGRYKPHGGQWHKTINFEKVDPARKSNIHGWLEWYSRLRKIEGFYKIGKDIIDGERFDIWEGEYTYGVGDNISIHKLQTWLSPATAEVGRIKSWEKQGNDEWRQRREYTKFERNVSLPPGIFRTEPPDGYEIQTTKETATVKVRRKRDIYEGTQFNYAPLNYWVEPVFLLKDGSFLACWQSVDAKESRDQSSYFKNLQVGGDLPKLPVEVFAFSPEPNLRDVQFVGFHIAHTEKETEKGRRWYEWTLYTPDKQPPEPNTVLLYRLRYVLNVDKTKEIRLKQTALPDWQEIKTEDDFNTFVLGAMAELSDDGKAPENVTYESVLQLTKQIRESITQ